MLKNWDSSEYSQKDALVYLHNKKKKSLWRKFIIFWVENFNIPDNNGSCQGTAGRQYN